MDYFNKWFYWETNNKCGYVYFINFYIKEEGHYYGWTFENKRFQFSNILLPPFNWSIKTKDIPLLTIKNKQKMIKDCFEKIK